MREGGLSRQMDSEPRKDNRRERALAGAVLGLAGGVLVSVYEHLPDTSNQDSVPQHEFNASNKQKLTEQLASLHKLVEQLPAVEEGQEKRASNVSPDFRTLGLTSELFQDFPNKDKLPERRGRSLLVLDPDYASWEMLKTNHLEEVYQATLDDLTIDADELSVHVYSKSHDSLDMVFTFEKHMFADEEYLMLGSTEGYNVGTWRMTDLDTEVIKTKLRQQVQQEIAEELVEETKNESKAL